MKYEMRLPPGVPAKTLAEILEKYNLEVKQTNYGPIMYGDKEDLENAQEIILKALNDRVKELEGNKKE